MMTMEASSNSRDDLTASLQLSVEQWELLRRLRNSHLTRKQIIRAYDELDRLDRELGNLFHTAHPPTLPSSSLSSANIPPNDPVSPSIINSQQTSPASSLTNNKRSQSHTGNSLPPIRPTNGYHIQQSSSNPNIRGMKNGFKRIRSIKFT